MSAKIAIEVARQDQTLRRSEPRSRLVLVLLMVVFALGAAFRVYRLSAPGVLVEREYTSAIFARSFYFDHDRSIEAWRVDLARTLKDAQPVLEPPLTELLVSLINRAAGREVLWAARLLTSAFWLAGGVCLF
jgi:hypothetical protein